MDVTVNGFSQTMLLEMVHSFTFQRAFKLFFVFGVVNYFLLHTQAFNCHKVERK